VAVGILIKNCTLVLPPPLAAHLFSGC
jgi:hypothetical protein